MKKKAGYVTVMAGIFLLAAGLYLIKIVSDPQGILLTLPYVCIGIGCGLFGHGMGSILSERIMRKHPHIQRQMEIEQKDERNTAIADRAKGKAFDMMTFVFGALMLAFALMSVTLPAVLLLVFAYLFVHGYAIYYRCRYEKEM